MSRCRKPKSRELGAYCYLDDATTTDWRTPAALTLCRQRGDACALPQSASQAKEKIARYLFTIVPATWHAGTSASSLCERENRILGVAFVLITLHGNYFNDFIVPSDLVVPRSDSSDVLKDLCPKWLIAFIDNGFLADKYARTKQRFD